MLEKAIEEYKGYVGDFIMIAEQYYPSEQDIKEVFHEVVAKGGECLMRKILD